MKKTLMLMTAGTAALIGLTSCSQDEPVSENRDNAISFRSAITRASETTNANLSEITAAAFLNGSTFFTPTAFVKGDASVFESETTYNWPGDDSSLDFYAYAPANPGGTITLTPSSKVITGFSPASDLGSQVDLITAVASGNKSANEVSGVPLSFGHRLAQIEIQAKTDNEAYTFEVTGIRIGKAVSKGDFDFDSNSWTLGSDKAIYEDTYTTPVTLGSDLTSLMGAGGSAMLIPQKLTAWNPDTDASNTSGNAYLAIKLKINTVAGAQVYPFPSNGDCQWAAVPISTNWEAGKKYVYKLDLTHGAGNVDPNDPDPGKPILGGPIFFTCDVESWVPASEDVPMTPDTQQN